MIIILVLYFLEIFPPKKIIPSRYLSTFHAQLYSIIVLLNDSSRILLWPKRKSVQFSMKPVNIILNQSVDNIRHDWFSSSAININIDPFLHIPPPGRWWFQADNLNDFKSKYAQAYWSINLINISASITQPSYHYIHLHSKYLSKKQKSKLFSSCIQFITEIRKSFLGITKFSI